MYTSIKFVPVSHHQAVESGHGANLNQRHGQQLPKQQNRWQCVLHQPQGHHGAKDINI